MNFIITTCLRRKDLKDIRSPVYFLSTRPLTAREVYLARQFKLKRHYLTELQGEQRENFFKEFDAFWDQIARCFNSRQGFWRNVVSSKMQEWEGALAYFALQLFSLTRAGKQQPGTILFICASLEEAEVCASWGKKHGWHIEHKVTGVLRSAWNRFVQEIVNSARFVYLSAVCCYYKINSRPGMPNEEHADASVLIASLFYSHSFKNGCYEDPFFGDVHRSIESGQRSVTYLGLPLNDFKKASERIRRSEEVRLVLPFTFLTFPQLFRLLGGLFLRRLKISRLIYCGCDFSKLVAWNTRRATYFNLHAEIYYAAMRSLLKHRQFSRLILPYEGNVFERACIQAFREHARGKIVGYSHAVVFPLNMKIRLSPVEKISRPEPDLLLCAGPENKRQFESVRNQHHVKTRSACSLRYIPVAAATPSGETNRDCILVALDGVRGCAVVLDWLMENADIFRNRNVIVRAHPNVPVKELQNQCLNPWPEIFSASNADLETDLAKCFCVLYRQTSVGMQAILNGLMAVHLNIDAPLACDPLQSLDDAVWRVSGRSALARAIREIELMPASQKLEKLERAQAYITNYFAPPNNACKDLFLNA